jgi:hypothetical protein
MALSTFTFRASGFFCEGCEVMEAQDDLQRRFHFRHFVAAHPEFELLGSGQPYHITGYHSIADLISCIPQLHLQLKQHTALILLEVTIRI